MTKRRNPPTSLKQILVRDFNWRIGNLRRIYVNVGVLTNGRNVDAQKLIHEEIGMQTSRHKHRLSCAERGIESQIMNDQIWARAVSQYEHSKKMKALLDG